MTDKEFVLSHYPNAYCVKNKKGNCYDIFLNNVANEPINWGGNAAQVWGNTRIKINMGIIKTPKLKSQTDETNTNS